MEKGIVYSHYYDAEKLNIKKSEVFRYMGQRCPDGRIDSLTDAILCDAKKCAKPKASFCLCDIDFKDGKILAGDMEIESEDLAKNLSGCEKAILLMLTLGTDADRFIEAKLKMSASDGVCADAVFTALCEEYADQVCEMLCEHFEKEGYELKPRFSAGYGDFKIEHQKDFIKHTDAGKRCGIGVTDALMLVPTKSVSAIIGLKRK